MSYHKMESRVAVQPSGVFKFGFLVTIGDFFYLLPWELVPFNIGFGIATMSMNYGGISASN